jgi:hypothetical protein
LKLKTEIGNVEKMEIMQIAKERARKFLFKGKAESKKRQWAGRASE